MASSLQAFHDAVPAGVSKAPSQKLTKRRGTHGLKTFFSQFDKVHFGLGRAGGLYALANSLAFADFCDAVRRNARGIGAIADFLSLVFAQRRQG
jgi:hypothetical protein